MIVQHNISSMNANRQLGITTGNLSKSTEKLSSGYRINRAGDDAAGLAISEKMRGQIRGLNQASTNSEDGISLIQTAEGALQETQNILQRMRELAVQAATDTNTNDDRTQIQSEITQLTNEVDRIATTSEFNTKKLLDGSLRGALGYEAGRAKIEGTFKNGYAQVIALDVSTAATVGLNEVIRIEITEDVSATGVTVAYGPGGKATVTSLKGTSASVQTFSIDANGDATITINNAAYENKDAKNDAPVNTSVTFKVSGAVNLKAGDVITITLSKMQGSQKAEEGKEALRFQVGANAGQEIQLGIRSMKAKDLGIVQVSAASGEALDVTVQAKASLAIEAFDQALQKVSTERAKLGAVQNRLEHTIANLDTSGENLQAAESRIRDVDMADEMTSYSKSQILMQAGQSMLAQANQANQGVVNLLQ